MSPYLTNSGKPVTQEMAAFLRTIENRQYGALPAGNTEKELVDFAACAGISVAGAKELDDHLELAS